jgi:hypothetical protein
MRDALRAVGVVIGVILLVAGGVGFLRGNSGVPEYVGVGVGATFLLLVAVLPPGKRPPPPYEEW